MKQYLIAILVPLLLLSSTCFAEDFVNPKVKPKLSSPTRISASENAPPLPLPAVPLRRSEKKHEPSPPGLVGVINLSDLKNKVPTTTIDIERLMSFANHKLNIKYRFIDTNFANFSWNPSELPILYLTGWTQVPDFSNPTISKLQRYLYDGGTLIVHSQCGRPEFTKSMKIQIARIFPDREIVALDTDSPIFHSYFNIDKMRVRKDNEPFKNMVPYLETIFLGCRPTIIISPIDLSCGWDVDKNPIMGGILFHQDDATRLGTNIITMCLANLQYSRSWGTEKIYHEQNQNSRDKIIIGQIIHNGEWNPTPHGLPNLIKYSKEKTTLNLQFKQETINLSDNIFQYTMLYMTGLRDFRFSEKDVENLRKYLKNGGFLLIDSAAGMTSFDQAVRRELKRIFLNEPLKNIEQNSPIFSSNFLIKTVEYSPLVKSQQIGLNIPVLEGITIDNQICVVYSSLSISTGWENLNFAYGKNYSPDDSIKIGINIITYALTH